MKRVLTFFLLAAPCFAAHEFTFPHPNIPAPRIIEAIEPDPQTHTFPALDTNNAFTGNNTHSGTETFLNDVFVGAASPPTNTNCGFHFLTFLGSGVGSAVLKSTPTTTFPQGCDTVYQHDGPSDNNWAITSVRTTTTASITGGAANTNVLVGPICNFNSFFGGNQGPCGTTSSFAQTSGQQITIGRTVSGLVFGNAGALDVMTWSGGSGCAAAHTWGVVDATHLCLNPTSSYSGTTDIESGPGITFVHDWVWQMHGDATKPSQQSSNPGLAIEDKNGTPYFTFPSDLTTTAPNNAINVKAPATFTGLLNCKNIEASIFCIDTTNTQGWTGSDAGAQINSAIAAWPSTGGRLLIASGVYSVSTPITGAQNGEIQCSASPATSGARALLNFTPATGAMITWSNSSFGLFDCDLKTTTSTTSVALQLTHVNYKTNIQRNHINGFFGGIAVTGDGVSAFSTGVNIADNLVDGLNANCGGGAGYGVNIDHARDVTFDKNQFYSVTDCATGIPMILDTGVGGIWMAGSTFEQGLHAGIIRNTNQGGAYGGVPAAIFAHAITWDLSPGGDALLFDSTLGTGTIRFFCASCWAAGAGKNTAGTVITAGAVGFNIQGGSDIHFVGGISRINASWGAVFGTSGTSISIDDMEIHANNQGNTAGVGGILVAGPTNWKLTGNRSGNAVDSGGNQVWGADISGASTNGVLAGNDFRNNTSGRVKYPAGVAQAGVDAPEFGSGTGLHIYGPEMFLEQAAPSGVGSEEVCYGDSTLHALKCSYNNGTFFQIPQVITATSAAFATATTAGTCVQNTTAVAGAATTMTVSVSPVSTPGVGSVWSAFVSSTGNVTINECAVATSAGGTIAFNIRVTP